MEDCLNENFGGVKAKSSSDVALQRFRTLGGDAKNLRRRFSTANLTKRSEAEAIKRANHEKLRDAVLVSKVAHQLLKGTQIKSNYVVPQHVHEAGFGICADELSSIVEGHDLRKLVTHGGVSGICEKLASFTDGLSMDKSKLATRRNIYGINKFTESKVHNFWDFEWEALLEMTLIILGFCALISLISLLVGIVMEGWPKGAHDILGTVARILFVVFVMATWYYKQPLQFKDLDKEKRNTFVQVTRNGCCQKMSIYDLLPGDIVHLSIGDQVPADGLFLSGFPLLIDESSLTGKSEPINVNPNNPFLLSGTKVQDGSCKMLVTTVGMRTQWGKLMATISKAGDDKTPFQVKLNGVATIIGKISSKNLEKNLQRNEEEIRELKEILQRERQEKEQLTQQIEENEHEKLLSEQVKEILIRNLHRNEEEIGELKETLQRERQEKDQLSRKIEENEHEKLQSEQVKVEKNLLRSQKDQYINQIRVETKRRLALEKHVSGSELAIKDLQAKLASDRDRIVSLQADLYNLQQKRDNLVKLVKELCIQAQKLPFGSSIALNSEFSLQELKQATQDFSESLKIGEGGFGPVYKGSLRQTTVAIKVLHSQSLQGISQFQQEITILTKVRHPNLVTLIGACSELSALVYEYLPNGSLEDRLTRANNTPPLTWQVRSRIIGEICLALIFLHSNKPQLVVHGDLKPENILLDTNLVSKLSDFGISRLLKQPDTNTTAFFQASRPVGTLFYLDPEFMQTGILTPKSDIYSLGIIILRLLTGKPPSNIARQVQDAMRDGILLSVIDESAGTWPFEQAKELAEIALRCADLTRSLRPDLVNEVWAVVEPLMKAATCMEPQSHGIEIGEESIPSHFICPTFQEVMQDPCIAADRFTYEADTIRQWLRSGHNTSQMTNLELPHRNWTNNRVLSSAIKWLQQHP